jgi:hypothetical protein
MIERTNKFCQEKGYPNPNGRKIRGPMLFDGKHKDYKHKLRR